jgi:hypothetical protein
MIFVKPYKVEDPELKGSGTPEPQNFLLMNP